MNKEIIKRIFSYKFHLRGFFNPFINFQIAAMENYMGINENKREVPIIVSLTSYEKRFKELPITIYSLLNQTLKPDKIILWLDKECSDLQYLPYELTQFIKNGLEIRFVKDLGVYTKSFYTFKEYSDSIIVTADDDIYYKKDWLKKLYLSYISHPQDIHVHRAHKIKTCSDSNIAPYNKWEKQTNQEGASYKNFLTGVGGVLYPPKCFSKEVLREDVFLKHCPKADDIWLWVMALVHNRKIRVVKKHYKTLISTNLLKQLFDKNLYTHNRLGGNDEQLKNLIKFYKNNILPKIEKEELE